MTLVNDLKKLVANSPLFVEASKLAEKPSKKGRKGRYGRDAVKIGQGGTLDPLADGVLGNSLVFGVQGSHLKQSHSDWCRQRDEKAIRVP